ncbi:hypothetical protein [Bifidobacterium longum]|uniref:hypothetical protein n=1 Tax=Bifidobacterium longum TaxID=216816 RepID=UPI0030F38CC5
MNSITVHAASSKLNPCNIGIETTEDVSPAMLHTTARLLEGSAAPISETSPSTPTPSTKENTNE